VTVADLPCGLCYVTALEVIMVIVFVICYILFLLIHFAHAARNCSSRYCIVHQRRIFWSDELVVMLVSGIDFVNICRFIVFKMNKSFEAVNTAKIASKMTCGGKPGFVVSRLGLVGSVGLGLGLVTSLRLGLRVSVSISGSGDKPGLPLQ